MEAVVSTQSTGGTKLIHALDLLDKGLCHCIVATRSRRRAWRVVGGTKGNVENHLCFPHFCSCPHFTLTVMTKENELLCKHQLAVLLGEALNMCHIREVDDVEFGRLLST
eukprot:TRINITY_DN13729_c0_g2_i2.p1 TRINITY_DN13729_c0_g2~~TRINITY_DN13729_c0_g2_i2.p1  ORF type:complete len:110 (+),score=22.30 TRINITY_DN13729_c0_g2_i2:89-418(+)